MDRCEYCSNDKPEHLSTIIRHSQPKITIQDGTILLDQDFRGLPAEYSSVATATAKQNILELLTEKDMQKSGWAGRRAR